MKIAKLVAAACLLLAPAVQGTTLRGLDETGAAGQYDEKAEAPKVEVSAEAPKVRKFVFMKLVFPFADCSHFNLILSNPRYALLLD